MATDGEGMCILASSLPYQEATIKQKRNRSMYTYYLVKGLKGEGLEVFDHAGNITVDTLSSYVYKKIDSLPLDERPTQRPFEKDRSFGRLWKMSEITRLESYRFSLELL